MFASMVAGNNNNANNTSNTNSSNNNNNNNNAHEKNVKSTTINCLDLLMLLLVGVRGGERGCPLFPLSRFYQLPFAILLNFYCCCTSATRFVSLQQQKIKMKKKVK